MSQPSELSPLPPTLSFEQAMKELEGIVRKLEGGNADLEGSIQEYLKGMQLKEYCEEKLKAARLKVETVMRGADGSMKTQAFDAGA